MLGTVGFACYRRRLLRLGLSLAFLLLLGSCMHNLLDTPRRSDRRSGAVMGSVAGALAAQNAAALQASCGLPPVADADERLALRPLSNAEYSKTVQDLLQITADPTASFPSDSSTGGFDTDGTEHVITTTLMQSYLAASMPLASAFVAQPNANCAAAGYSPSCSGPALVTLAQAAYRRPLLAGEQQRLTALPATLVQAGAAPQDAYASGVAAILIAPQFIYRMPLTPSSGLAQANQFALASNLSYALWGDMPDSPLLAAAQNGNLSSASVVADQIARMLNDPRAAGFVHNFASQWLGLRSLATSPAAAGLAPGLVSDISQEPLAYMTDFLTKNVSVKGLLDGNFSYISAASAPLYNLPLPAAAGLSRIDLTGNVQRGGLLTQAAFLLQTSNPDKTSPVKRGKWILDNILCQPPPPPPQNMQSATVFSASEQALPPRQELAQHRSTPGCTSCHQSMDPIGLGFENYDRTGAWRSSDSFGPIDASGTLPGQGDFANASQLAQLLKNDPAFPRCLVSKMAVYALGRQPSDEETCVINKIADKTADSSYGMQSMLLDFSLSLLTR